MKDPNIFESAHSGYQEIYTEVLKLTKGYSGRYLDLGAGQGKLTERLIEQGHRDVYACDKHPEYFRVNGLSCQHCDLNYEALPFADNFFDVVTCTEVIEHIENPRHLLREIHRVLKTKGRVIISTPNSLSLRGRLSFLFRGYSSYLKKLECEEESAHITMITRVDLLRIFRELGFGLVRIIYTHGAIPKLSISWQTVFPFLKGELFSDTIILIAEKL